MATANNILPTQAPEPGSFRLIFSLGTAGFFSGLLLVVVFLYTSPLIEENQKKALQTAIFKVLPDCASFELFVKGPSGLERSISTDEKGVFAGYDKNGTFIGFAIPAEESGFQDIIKVLYGYDPESERIIGFEVLESKETPGLGDKIFKDEEFTEAFRSLVVQPIIEAVKKGKKSRENQVETITGATISSKAVINMLNNSLSEWESSIDGYLETNTEPTR